LLIDIHLGVCNACFYYGNESTVKIIDINFIVNDNAPTVLSPTPE
jgi:hypothetical protein